MEKRKEHSVQLFKQGQGTQLTNLTEQRNKCLCWFWVDKVVTEQKKNEEERRDKRQSVENYNGQVHTERGKKVANIAIQHSVPSTGILGTPRLV